MKFAIFGKIAICEVLKEAKFDHEITAIVLVVEFFSVRVKFLLNEKFDGFDVLAHYGEMHHIIAFSSYVIDVTIALVNHSSCE